MRLRRFLIPAIALWGAIAAVSLQSCVKPAQNVPDDVRDLESLPDGDAEKTVTYWGQIRGLWQKYSATSISSDEFQSQGQSINSLEDGVKVWGELAKRYRRSADSAAESALKIKQLATADVDRFAVEFGEEMARYLLAKQSLLLISERQSLEMTASFESILSEGKTLDWNSPRGKQLDIKEKAIRANMEQTAATKGEEDKRLIDQLRNRSNNTIKKLEKRYNKTFSIISI